MSMPFVVEGPEIVWERQSEFVLVGGASEIQILGSFTSKTWKMFWATEQEVQDKIAEVQGAGWVLDGDPSLTPIYQPLDCYNAEINAHKHTAV